MNSLGQDLSRDRVSDSKPGRRTAPAYESIYNRIRGNILRGDWSAGQRVPTEQGLADEFQVSVGTIRKTQELLVQEGLLVKQQGRGTFVADDVAGQRRVLWVCGLDVFDGDVSSFYTEFLDACNRAGRDQGLSIEPAWVSHIRPDESEPYMGAEAEARYAGYIFVGCEWPKHPLLHHVADRGLPYAHIEHWDHRPCGVLIDIAQGVRLGVEQLHAEGCEKITVLGFEEHLGQLDSLLTELGVARLAAPTGERTSDVERNGAVVMDAFQPTEAAEGLLILDDIIARGATRALLGRGGSAGQGLRVAVMSSRRSVIPLGLPVTHIVHDSQRVADASVDLLGQQMGTHVKPAGAVVPFEIWAEAEAASASETVVASQVLS